MAGTFDLAEAIAERERAVPPYQIKFGDHTLELSPTVTDEALAQWREGDLDDFFEAQMSTEDFDKWIDLGLQLDQLMQGRILFGYFDHIGYDNPFTRDGKLAARDAVGEGLASNRSSRRAAKR